MTDNWQLEKYCWICGNNDLHNRYLDIPVCKKCGGFKIFGEWSRFVKDQDKKEKCPYCGSENIEYSFKIGHGECLGCGAIKKWMEWNKGDKNG